jgi:transcriptional regulator with XRE-family HTH domain
MNQDRAMIIRKAVGDLIRTQRLLREPLLTQEKLAEHASISFEHLNHIENYKAMPSIEVLDRIAKALGHRRLSEFLGRDQTGIL